MGGSGPATDSSEWDGNAAMSACNDAACYRAITAGERTTGEPSERGHWALPHHKRPGGPANAAGLRNARARFAQTQGLKNREAARRHLFEVHRLPSEMNRDEEPHMYPRNNLVRSVLVDDAVQLRDADSAPAGRTLHGHFALFNEWAEIRSLLEGHFIERIAPGAFQRAFAEQRDRIKVLYDHGRDPTIGNKPLGRILDLSEDKRGAAYEVELIRTSYNDDFVIPAADAGVLGASFRFSVPEDGDSWVMEPRRSNRNPEALPERTIHDVDLYEFGPVTFPAYEGASVGVRCGTDEFIDNLRHDPRFLTRFIERVGPNVVEQLLDSLPPTAQEPSDDELPATPQIDEPEETAIREEDREEGSVDDQPQTPSTAAERRKMARLIEAERLGVGKEI